MWGRQSAGGAEGSRCAARAFPEPSFWEGWVGVWGDWCWKMQWLLGGTG